MESLYLDIILRAVFRNADKVNSTLIFWSTVLFFFFTDVHTWYRSLKYMFYQDQSLKKNKNVEFRSFTAWLINFGADVE